ncbi:MAG TPA: carboxypeptidase regulatory-like domain-containing protein [Chitinophagaceae bacterium]|jgi:hypothetical protein
MKRFIAILSLLVLSVICIYAFQSKNQTSIVGRINPVSAANTARAVSGHDSITSNIINGAFSFEAKPGIYKVVIDAVEPYKDAVLENINVKDGQTVDVGEIALQKKNSGSFNQQVK